MNLHVLLAAVVVGTLVVMLGSAELGYRVGRKSRSADPEVASQVGTWEAALLGLLALLIGFTFAMAVTRFDGRRDLIRDEANAIYEVARRAEYLPPPEPERLGGLLRRYVDARIRFYDAGLSIERTNAAEDEAIGLRREIWSEVVKIARANFNSEMASLFVQSVDDLIDMGESGGPRWTTMFRTPSTWCCCWLRRSPWRRPAIPAGCARGGTGSGWCCCRC